MAEKKTYVIMHGFAEDETFGDKYVPDLLEHGDYNVLTVNWPTLAHWTNYFKAAENSLRVGDYAGELVSDLVEREGLAHADVVLLGHSLGAHGAGHIGRTVRDITGDKVARLSG